MPIKPESALTELKLKTGRERRLEAGHLWVFSNELEAVPKDGGPIARLKDASGAFRGIGLYNSSSLIAWRMLSRKAEPVDPSFFKNRLESALGFREKLKPGADSYRLCFGESDGLPGLVIDRYGDILVLQILSAAMESQLEMILEALGALLSPKGIYLRNDHRARTLEGLGADSRVAQGEVPPRVQLTDGGLKYLAPLTEGQKTGFYFDQSENRAYLRPFCKGRRVLDLYTYTGGFALNAAAGGAKSVLGIDSSATAVGVARENARMNKLKADFKIGDAEEALSALPEAPKAVRPDLIVIDPPSFVPSKKHLPKAARAYVRMNAMALKALPPGGLLATSTCSHHVSREILLEILRQAQTKARVRTRILALRGQAGDHPVLLAMPETEYLHFALLEVV